MGDTAGISEDGDTQVTPDLRRQGGVEEVIVAVERGVDRRAVRAGTVTFEDLRADSERTLGSVAQRLQRLEAVRVQQRFWVGNALSVRVDLDRVDVEQLAAVDGVRAVVPNVEARLPEPVEDEGTAVSRLQRESNHTGPSYTYGLEQIDVPGFRERYGTLGGGTSIAVLDDGVANPADPHPDLNFTTTAIADDGNVTTGTLGSAFEAHGEHVAGTATGALVPAGDVPRYSVAPNASLTMINVFEGGASLADILAAIEYSVTQDIDVVTMSLGFPSSTGFSTVAPAFEAAMQDANAAGTAVVASAGNSGAGASGGPATSPGAEFSGFSVGASTAAETIAGFSSGTTISPFQIEFIGTATYPANYPYRYTKPDVSAPGSQVLSTGPLGTVTQEDPTYSVSSGTSMAAPHVAGALALIEAAIPGDQDPRLLEAALAETARTPDGVTPEEGGRDTRYGTGIINVTAATDAVANGTLTVEGTVTNETGAPVAGATVETEAGALTATDENGSYTLYTTRETANVTVDGFGYEPVTRTVTEDGNGSGTATADVQLGDDLAVNLLEGQPAFAAFGGDLSVTVDVRNLESLTVNLTDATNVSASNLSLRVAGQNASFGEPVALGGYDGVANVTVDIADGNYTEGQVIGLAHTFAGANETFPVETGPTELTATVDPAVFELSNLTVPDALVVGERLSISAEVTNTGQVTDEKDIQPVLNTSVGTLVLPQEAIELAPGETTTYAVSAAGIGDFLGGGEVFRAGFRVADAITENAFGQTVVEGLNDRQTAPVALQAAGPRYEIVSLDAPARANASETVAVNATVRNVGNESATQPVTFRFDGEPVTNTSVSLAAFELNTSANVQTVTFQATLPAEPGIFRHGVSTAADSENATIAVGGAEFDTVTVVESDNRFEPGQGAETVAVFEDHLPVNFETQVVEVQNVSAAVIEETDVFVFHDFGLEVEPASLIETVENDPETGAVYLEQAVASNSISARSNALGDPAGVNTSLSGDAPAVFEIQADHPIFDGVGEPGDVVPIHTVDNAARAWLEGADGESLATVGDQSGTDGSAVTVDPDTGVVLVSSIAPSVIDAFFAPPTIAPEDITPEAGQILANAVDFADSVGRVGQTSIDVDFVGVVDDSRNVSLAADGIVVDGELADGEPVTFTVGGEPVATTTVENGSATATVDPAVLQLEAGQNVTVGIEEYPTLQPASVETVHEVRSLDAGYNLVSVPQAADLSTEGVGALNTWNASAERYETVSDAEFSSTSELHQGVYVSAMSEDARLGFTFGDGVPFGGTADIVPGWNLIGSNFAIDSTQLGDQRSLTEDLLGVDVGQLTVFSSNLDARLDGDSTVSAFETYWVFRGENTSTVTRGILSPSYTVEDREDVLGTSEPARFEVGFAEGADLNATAGEEVSLDVVTENTGEAAGSQTVTLSVGDTQVGQTTVSLDGGESQTVTFSFTADAADDGASVTVESDDDVTSATLTVADAATSLGAPRTGLAG